jgi:hypothetical protein
MLLCVVRRAAAAGDGLRRAMVAHRIGSTRHLLGGVVIGTIASASLHESRAECVRPTFDYDAALAKPVSDRDPRELAWSAVTAFSEKMKNCRCCNAQFGGGPNGIVQHVTTAYPLVNASTDIVNEFRAIKAKMADARAA